MKQKTLVRLPSSIKPLRYVLTLKPDLEKFTFSGEEVISFDIQKPTKEIKLHAKELDIKNVLVNGKGFKHGAQIIFDVKTETVTFVFDTLIPKGKAVLSLAFDGLLTDSLRGFYRSKYTVDGKEKYMATTQFEATDARRAFPCVDEPAAKAIFEVNLVVKKDLATISNTIETKVEDLGDGYKVVQYAPTPKMSTYLLAFIIGEFESIEEKSKHGVLVRVFTTPGKKQQAQFALKTASRCLDFYDDYFAIPYPLPVLDLIAVPDFAAGAMENWGAVTYRETALLVDEKNSSASNKQWVAIVIAHELAHQWFGNLVTMDWWTDLWLNEGFASYMEYLATDYLFPEWHMWDQYVAERFAVALRLDALQTTHPIEIEVHHPSEITEIFDQVSYAKGSTVIRMLAQYLGADVFRDGLRHYLKKHQYANTITKDLWAAFEVVSKKPVTSLMQNWTSKPGYPLIEVEQKNNILELTQKRYFSSELSRKKYKDATLWQIPVATSFSNAQTDQFLMTKKTAKVQNNAFGWVKLNTKETSLFRTKYSPTMLENFKPAIASKALAASDRLGIIRDTFGLAQTGEQQSVVALNLVPYYQYETELPVWEEIASGLHMCGDLFEDQPWYKEYEKFCLATYATIAQSVGWQKVEGEEYNQSLMRSLVLMEMGSNGDVGTIEYSRQLFKASLKGTPVPVDVRSVVYNLVAENGGIKEFNLFLKMYKESSEQHQEQDRIGRALGSFKDPVLLKKVMDFAVSDAVRIQDSPSIFINAARNFYGRDLAWNFIKENWDMIFKKYGTGGHLLEWFIMPFSKCTNEKKATEIEAFFKKHPTPILNRTISQVVERIRSSHAWIKRDRELVKNWIKQR